MVNSWLRSLSNHLVMTKPNAHRLEKAGKRLRETLTIDKIRQIPKYRDISTAQYLRLINSIEKMAVLLLDSYCFIENDTS